MQARRAARRSARPGEVSVGRGVPSGESPMGELGLLGVAAVAERARGRSIRPPCRGGPRSGRTPIPASPGTPRSQRRLCLRIGRARAGARSPGKPDGQAGPRTGSPDGLEGPASERPPDPSAQPRSFGAPRWRSPPAGVAADPASAGRRAARSIGPARHGRSRARWMPDGRTIVRCRMRPASVATSDSAIPAGTTAPIGEVVNRLPRRGRDRVIRRRNERYRRQAGSGARRTPGRSDLGTHDPKGPPGRRGERPSPGGRGANGALTRRSTARRCAREPGRGSGAGHRNSRDRVRRSGRRSRDAGGRAARSPARLPAGVGVRGQSSSKLSL